MVTEIVTNAIVSNIQNQSEKANEIHAQNFKIRSFRVLKDFVKLTNFINSDFEKMEPHNSRILLPRKNINKMWVQAKSLHTAR